MFYRACDKHVTVGLTSIHNFIHNHCSPIFGQSNGAHLAHTHIAPVM